MDIAITNSNVTTQAPAPELAPVGAGAAESAAKPLPDTILTGPGVEVTMTLGDKLAALGKDVSPDKAKVLTEMMNSYFQSLMTIAKNMAPSEKELKLRERRKEELEKQIRDLEAKKVTVEEALIRFQNTFLAAADKALLESNMAKHRQDMV